ncbi:MAG TPA: F0F1 ATP synthase subunit epsilon [Candidatus Xenobia bacterium]|nr:F0F1 ATP synthase subunit epsilon [Candidatus Xenobia bacterium]
MLPQVIELQVVTPERLLVHEEVHEVQVPGLGGYLGILPGHAPLLSELQMGELSYRKGNHWSYLTVFRGFVEVLPERVIVLAEVGERGEEIDLERAQRARQRAEERLKNPTDPDLDWNRARVALERALIRIQVAGKAGASPSGHPAEESAHVP